MSTTRSVDLDLRRRCADEPGKGHNRWHPDITPALVVEPGETFELDTRDALDGQLTRASVAADVGALDRDRVHPLTGPVCVTGALPGELLEIEILAVEPSDFGFTFLRPGAGLLPELIDEPALARWELGESVAISDDVPGVRIPAAPFPGVIGVAPSRALLTAILRREAASGGSRPEPREAVPATGRIPADGLRTLPPRENAGNLDVKDLGAGASLLLPVWVDGGLLSVGDAHYAQGDGEVGGNAIEMAARVRLRATRRPGVAAGVSGQWPRLRASGEPRRQRSGGRWLGTGISVGGGSGDQLREAARMATLQIIERLGAERGYSTAQALIICSVAMDLRISEVVNGLNWVVTAELPLDIFATERTAL